MRTSSGNRSNHQSKSLNLVNLTTMTDNLGSPCVLRFILYLAIPVHCLHTPRSHLNDEVVSMARVSLILFFLSSDHQISYYRLWYGAHEAFRMVVPVVEDRIPLTPQNGIYQVLCCTPFIFLSYLARRPDTYLIRLLWLPTVITTILVATYRFYWPLELNRYNWVQRK